MNFEKCSFEFCQCSPKATNLIFTTIFAWGYSLYLEIQWGKGQLFFNDYIFKSHKNMNWNLKNAAAAVLKMT